MYFKNTHATESMDDFKLWISNGTPSPNTSINFGFEVGYKWEPYFTGDGATTFDSTASDPIYQLPIFTLAAWFKTSATMSERGYIVNKGGEGSESAGQNDNYSLAMNTDGKIRVGFEEGDGTDRYVTSPLSYNNGLWHLAVVTYSGSNIRLYIDNMVTNVASLATTAIPETSGTNPVVIGRRSRSSANFFNGLIDEVRIWGNAKSESSRVDLLQNIISQNNLVYENKFGADSGILTAQTIANVNTAPAGITWYGPNQIPFSLGVISAGQYFPVWIRLIVSATATADPAINDSGIFTAEFDIPQGGTGSGGGDGGTGGNPPPTNTNYKIAFFGDEGCEPETDDLIDLIEDEDYDLCVSVGDHAYESPSCWINRFNPIKSIFKVSAYGNHEYTESGGTSQYKSFFGHTRTYNKFKFQNIMFFSIDSNDDRSGVDLDDQVDWLTDELEAIKNDSTITWRIVLMHHPWFGSDSDHSYNEYDQVEKFHQLCVNYKVSFVYTGHNHNWQRTKQVAYDSGSPKTPTVVDSTSPFSRNTAGLIHIISGTGGHDDPGDLYDLDSNPSFNGYQDNDHNGLHELVASNNGQTLTGRFRDNSGDTYDEFIINA